MKTLTKDDLDIEILIHPEYLDPKDVFKFQDQIDWVIEQHSNGNEWAWCSVEVKVSYKDFTQSEHLGACSYKDRQDFINGGYYDDMVSEACHGLIEQIVDSLKEFGVCKDCLNISFEEKKPVVIQIPTDQWKPICADCKDDYSRVECEKSDCKYYKPG